MARPNRINTKLEIIQVATHLFLTEGYTNTYVTKIAKELDISLGNLTFHFPMKEHLLEELAKLLSEYHVLVMEQEVEEGKTSLLAYLLELTSMMAVCEENAVAQDLYLSIYRYPRSLEIIRKTDTERVKAIFSEFCPDWKDEDFAATESIVSGIEYASLYTEEEEAPPLEKRISGSLEAVMKLYNVPEELRSMKIQKIHDMDYRRIGHRFINGFAKYVEQRNQKALEEALEQ